MFSNTGNLSFYLGITFIVLSLVGLIITYILIKKGTVEGEKLDKLIDLGKWYIVSVAIVLAAAIVNDGFREREQDIKEMDVFDKYISTITMAGGIEQRWLLCEYFAAVSPDGPLQKAWKNYQKILQPRYDEYRNDQEEIVEITNTVNPTFDQKQRLAILQEKNAALEQSFVQISDVNGLSAAIDEWVIIAGGDETQEEANFEVSKAKSVNYTASIYKKGNMFRTVVGPFFRKEQASEAIPIIKKSVNSEAYLVKLSNWCHNPIVRDGYIECN